MTAQSDLIAQLSAEVDTLKTTLSGQHGGEGNAATKTKDERIRALELELERLRS